MGHKTAVSGNRLLRSRACRRHRRRRHRGSHL